MNRGFTIGEDDWDLLDAMGHSFGEDMCCMRCDIPFAKHQKTGEACTVEIKVSVEGKVCKVGRPASTMRGARNSQSKLQEAQVILIRLRKEKGEATKILAKDFGVSTTTICDIVRGVRWTYLLDKNR